MRSARGIFRFVFGGLTGVYLVAVLFPALSTSYVEARADVERAPLRTLAGNYLAGRFARGSNDSKQAAHFYRGALLRDPGNEILLENGFMMEAIRGNWHDAKELASDLVIKRPDHRMAQMFLGLAAFKNKDLKAARAHFKESALGPIGELTSAISIAWTHMAADELDAALLALKAPRKVEWAAFYIRYHRALILDVAGRKDEARAAFARVFAQDSRTLRTALSYARHAAHAGDKALALEVLDVHFRKGEGGGHPLALDLKKQIEADAVIGRLVSNANEGIAEVFYGLGEALTSEGGVNTGILYLQLALYLDPGQNFALASLANAYETNKNYEEALSTYERIPAGTPLEDAIEIRKAFNLNLLDKVEAARVTLLQLVGDDNAAQGGVATSKGGVSVVVPKDVASAASSLELPDAEPVLLLGDTGENVRKLQVILSKLGYGVEHLDGIFGAGTRAALVAFQRDAKIDVDGTMGQQTVVAFTRPEVKAALLNASKNDAVPSAQSAALEQRRAKRLQLVTVYDALGNIMRSRKRYTEAIKYYSRALELVGTPQRRHWALLYSRGTCYERLKQWPKAEADLLKALELVPNQPLALNYLGYSWIDQNKNLKRGMTLIEKAVAAKPDDGYIVDSLGWAHYKLGNYEKAVRFLERSVELRPEDPVLNDHLGDALWQTSRHREARFQWAQALTLNPEAGDALKIKKKLKDGLPQKQQAGASQGATDAPSKRN